MNLRQPRVYTAPIPKMPIGLIELMEGLAKDVLKNNPDNIYEFCSQHMEKLLLIRDGDANKKGLTLLQKIARAQEKVRRRAELRRKRYDNEVQMLEAKVFQENRLKREIASDEQAKAEEFSKNPIPDLTVIELPKVKSEEDPEIKHGVNKHENDDDLPETCDNLQNQPEYEKVKSEVEENINKEKNIELVSKGDSNSNSLVQCYDEEIVLENNQEPKELAKIDILTQSCDDSPSDPNKGVEYVMSDTVKTSESLIKIEKNDNIDEQIALEEMQYHDSSAPVPDNVEGMNENSKIMENSDIELNENNNLNYEMLSSSANNLHQEGASKEKASCEVLHTLNNTMDLETAAITIQKVFRSFLFKSKTSSVDEPTNVDFNSLILSSTNEEPEPFDVDNTNKERRALGLSRMDTVLQTVNEEKSLSLSTDDSSTLSSAATIIQAHVRGFLVRNKFNINKTLSNASNIDTDIQSGNSLEKNSRNKTILNIHIVPEGENFISRDASLMTSYDISLDGSPPHSTNLHPLGYDKNERRKQLKREDAVQSISPPSNNSGKSEDVDSIKEVNVEHNNVIVDPNIHVKEDNEVTNIDVNQKINEATESNKKIKKDVSLDEMDVVGPFNTTEITKPQLMHSSEFHDIVLPTIVSRSNTSVVREFQNVLVYFLFWNNS